jgi:hypothetical protein
MWNDHDKLKHSFNDLSLLDVKLDGCETFLSDVLSKIKASSSNAAEVASESIVRGLKTASSGVIKTLGTRRMFIAHIYSRLKKDDIKDEITFTESFLKKVTRDGYSSDIINGLDDLQKAMDVLKDYMQELDRYAYSHLKLIEDIGGIKSTEDAVRVINGIEKLTFPKMNLSSVKDLPGGKSIQFNEQTNKFTLLNEDVSAEEETLSFAKDDVKVIFTKLNKLIEVYQYVVKSMNKYSDYVNKFNTVSGKSFAHLDTLKGNVSASILSDLRDQLEGNSYLFAFYSGLLPKVIIYLDDYVDVVSSYLSKQFN